jgi:hypothetical protein
MQWKGRIATAVSAVAIMVGGVMATAPQAEAAGGCPSARLCVWDGTGFTGYEITSASTNSCYDILDFGGFNYVSSYSNNLPGNAIVWDWDPDYRIWSSSRTLEAHGFSSDIGIEYLGYYGAVCTGGQVPWDYSFYR